MNGWYGESGSRRSAFRDGEGEDPDKRNRLIDALLNEVAPHDDIHGWGFKARAARAHVIAELKTKAARLP
jgi:hypothetical protein